MFAKKIFAILLFLVGSLGPVALQAGPGYTRVLDVDRGIWDDVPFDIANIPSYFSVLQQMAKYGIANEFDSDEFAQLSDAVFVDVAATLKEIDFDVQTLYVVQLNPKVSTKSTVAFVTNKCLFIDEHKWLLLGTKFKNANLTEIKKYILKRAIAQYKRGSYGKKLATKLFLGVALGYAMSYAMPQVTDFIKEQDEQFGVSQAVCSALPEVIKSVCSTLYIPTILTYIGYSKVASVVGKSMRWLLNSVVAKPYNWYLNRQVECDAVNNANKDLVYRYKLDEEKQVYSLS